MDEIHRFNSPKTKKYINKNIYILNNVLNFKFRLKPTKKQRVRLINTLNECKKIHNSLLETQKLSWLMDGKNISKFEMVKKTKGESIVFSQVKQNVAMRIGEAMKKCFKEKKGFPRFKKKVKSITYPQAGFKIQDGRIFASKIGSIPMVQHRKIEGNIKTLTIKQDCAGSWFIIFTTDHELTRKGKQGEIGIDVGISQFATLSNREMIENPKFLIKSEKQLKRVQRKLSRTQNKSKNRKKVKHYIAKRHIKVTNQRTDFLHKISDKLTKAYSYIAVEKLQILNMVKNHRLAKAINDASWNQFVQMLTYKAVACGGQLIQVNPRGTSKTCHKCKTETKMPLSKRIFKCPCCGLIEDRDVNAAKNILYTAGHAEINAHGEVNDLNELRTRSQVSA